MKINVKYFASVREAVGVGQESIELAGDDATVGAVRGLLVARGGVWEEALGDGRAVRMACNQLMCGAQTPVVDGAEVAFFPPVTGG
jgi:molybdopterin synthase sulfur carrier subunit